MGLVLESDSSALRRDATDLSQLIAPGTRLGKYEIVHRVAFGGMAEIYLARASGIHGFEKYVVLKRILPNYAAKEEFVRMFLKEARLAAALDHANIAHVYDIGEANGAYFFTMEYLHGEDLRQIGRHLSTRGESLPLEQALAIISGAASGLHFAHEKKGSDGRSLGIVHRDMSPSNVVVTYDGGVKIVDFGIAKMAADPDLSRQYALKGKLAYMSPEQLHNRPIDRRSDVFSLGIVLFEVTTGTRLFRGSNDVETMRLVLDGAIPQPSTQVADYPPELERIVMRALEKDLDKRYPSARALQLDLESFARESRLNVSSAGLAEWMERTFGPKRELWHALALPLLEGAATATAPPAPADGKESTLATKVVSRSDFAVQMAPAEPAVDVPLQVEEPAPAHVPVPAPAPVKSRARRTIALAAVAVAAVSGAVWLAHDLVAAAASARATTLPPAVVVAAEQGRVAIERGAEPAPPAPAPPLQAPPPAPLPAAELPQARPAVARRAHAAAPRSPVAAESFSAPFARREAEIRKCFDRSAADASAAGQISLRFQVARDGTVTSVVALPEALGATPLGACLVAVGTRTVFAPQPEPVTFRIPLTLQVGTREKALR